MSNSRPICGRVSSPNNSDKLKALADVVRTLRDAGGKAFDSSPMYGRAEAVLGELLAGAPDPKRTFIATKVWTRGREAGITQMERSFALLKTTRIDLMQVHNLVDWQTHVATLRGWKQDGRISYLAVTRYTANAYDELEAVMRKETLDFVQLNYSLDDRSAVLSRLERHVRRAEMRAEGELLQETKPTASRKATKVRKSTAVRKALANIRTRSRHRNAEGFHGF